YTGDITYYGTGLGACGITSSDSDMITAVAHSVFDAAMPAGVTNPNANPLCGKRIRVTRDYSEAGKGLLSVDVVVVDRCVGCQPTDLDLAPAVFLRLAPESKGRVLASWHWLD
ncbi:RlpA-like double-psi beta-barrel-protein domain-containing protein-containing protein, partial [Lasiosphaeria miniovina]